MAGATEYCLWYNGTLEARNSIPRSVSTPDQFPGSEGVVRVDAGYRHAERLSLALMLSDMLTAVQIVCVAAVKVDFTERETPPLIWSLFCLPVTWTVIYMLAALLVFGIASPRL